MHDREPRRRREIPGLKRPLCDRQALAAEAETRALAREQAAQVLAVVEPIPQSPEGPRHNSEAVRAAQRKSLAAKTSGIALKIIDEHPEATSRAAAATVGGGILVFSSAIIGVPGGLFVGGALGAIAYKLGRS